MIFIQNEVDSEKNRWIVIYDRDRLYIQMILINFEIQILHE